MAQISITLAPTLSISLTLTGGGATVTLGRPAPLVVTALYEFLRGPAGADAIPADLIVDPLAYYILAKS